MAGLLASLETLCENTFTDDLMALDEDPEQLWGAIVGGRQPSRYSGSPLLWNRYAVLRGHQFRFIPLDLPHADQLSSLLELFMSECRFLDLTITDPYKAGIHTLTHRYLPDLETDPPGRDLSSLNHLIRSGPDNSLPIRGLNTDGDGMLAAIRQRVDPVAKQALLLGAGGAARSIGYALLTAGCELIIANAFADELEETHKLLVRLFPGRKIRTCDFQTLRPAAELADIIINTIPAGCPVTELEYCALTKKPLVAETLYGGKEALQKFSLHRNLSYCDGREMLYEQFVLALEQIPQLCGTSLEAHRRALKVVKQEFLL